MPIRIRKLIGTVALLVLVIGLGACSPWRWRNRCSPTSTASSRRSTTWSPASAGCCRRCRWCAGCATGRHPSSRASDRANACRVAAVPAFAGRSYAALTRRKPFHIAVAAPDISTFEIALLLELAVDRNARQRRQMIAVRLEQHARPRRHRGLEAELGGDAEFARAGRGRIADRIGQMLRPPAERRLAARRGSSPSRRAPRLRPAPS